jgi:glycine dehydrogenase subunit 1
MTLGLLASPGSQGADVAVGDVQVFGNALSFGGPYAGYLATREELIRQLPGRLVGQTTDLDGRRSYALTLQAREQHIRRAKATSNVCTNQALNALAALVYLALAGPRGLAELGEVCVKRGHYLFAGLTALPGVEPVFSAPFFHEFALRVPGSAADFAAEMRARGVDPGVPLGRFDPGWEGLLLVAVTEMNTPSDLESYISAAQRVLAGTGLAPGETEGAPGGPEPDGQGRESGKQGTAGQALKPGCQDNPSSEQDIEAGVGHA